MARISLYLVAAVLFTCSCNNDHFITDKAYRDKVEIQFDKQKELAKSRSAQLFGVFDQHLKLKEREALKFIYAYSSLSDLADYNGDFFLQNIRTSFAARDTFKWGKTVPENLFRHFVLPVRVNNENLDSSRWVFFNELKERIKNLPMKDAALEVNHWCHEKVTYRGTDSRTSSPLASVKTAFGRCGEESTLTVAALRSVCIPARQCYTPRWAHCDDNHAWVEVWVDGQWHFIGACEPDADLDLAWFTKPAKRAMLVNTTVFGDYTGPEDILLKDRLFTRINVLEHYTRVKRIFAKITGSDGKPAENAAVEFQLYNYAEFYPLYRTTAVNEGLCSFTTGFGDLLVWAAKDGRFGFRKIDVRKEDTVFITLDHDAGTTKIFTLDLVPPAEVELEYAVNDSARAKNNKRLEFEDKLRGSYETTFIDSGRSERFARIVHLDRDTLWDFLHKSRGNWRTLTGFITQVSKDNGSLLFPLLGNISEKDLRDIDSTVLTDHIINARKFDPLSTDPAIFASYILSPRIDNEYLKPWRGYFQSVFDQAFIDGSRNDPRKIAGWIRNEVIIDDSGNYSRAPITPIGVYELKRADAHSAAICFVAICRSFGIGARLDQATKIPQYLSQGAWQDVGLFGTVENFSTKGTLILNNSPENVKKPEYSIHYTIEAYRDGFYKTLDYEGSEMVQNYPCTLDVPPGSYLMVTGNRLTNGAVLSNLTFFEVKRGEISEQTIKLRKDKLPLPDYGKINTTTFGKIPTEGLIIAWIDPGKEPTKHLLADLKLKRKEISGWKGKFVMVFPTEEMMKSFIQQEGTQMPVTITYTFQSTIALRPADLKLSSCMLKNLPAVIYTRSDGMVNYCSEGYRIGTGDDLVTLMGL